jgi:hypothetical protein
VQRAGDGLPVGNVQAADRVKRREAESARGQTLAAAAMAGEREQRPAPNLEAHLPAQARALHAEFLFDPATPLSADIP